MPIARLFVEGALEVQVLSPTLQGNPLPQQGGSKNSLKPRAWTERRENRVAAGYLRDRDFDYDPPSDLSRPTVDSMESGVPFGWRWCRHEVENYLIDPAVVCEATSWPRGDVEDALRQAAAKIREYEAARWTIGIARRALPPHYELRTRPDGLPEIGLPTALDLATVGAWAQSAIGDHRQAIISATEPTVINESLADLSARFDDGFVADVAKVLLWFSGKDLLAALSGWLFTKGLANPGAFRALLRDWIIGNAQRTLELLLEWDGMTQVMRA